MPARQSSQQYSSLRRIFSPKSYIMRSAMVACLMIPYILLLLYAPSNGLDQGKKSSESIHSHLLVDHVNSNIQRRSDNKAAPAVIAGVGRVLAGKDAVAAAAALLPKEKPSNATKVETNQNNSSLIMAGLKVEWVGCYTDAPQKHQRALRESFYSDMRRMTIETCLQYCYKKSLPYAGLEFSSECYCGKILYRTPSNSPSDCNMTCIGNKAQICGGAPFISIYKILSMGMIPLDFKPVSDVQNTKDGRTSDFRACVPRPPNATRAFKVGVMEESSNLTPMHCITKCEQLNYPISALGRGKECHCGRLTPQFNLTNAVDPKLCNSECSGDANIFCGAQNYLSVYQTLAEDTRCVDIKLMNPNTRPLIAIASFPGSGNTWIRYLIERATGIYTGSYYDDGDLFHKGFKGEREQWTKRNTVVVKTHRFDEEHVSQFDAAVLILRNPYKAILSEHNRKFGGHTGYASEKQYTTGTEWIDFVNGKSRTWTNTALNFMQYSKKILVVHYEDLHSDLYTNLKKIVKFVGIPVNEERLLCTLSSPNGKYKRPPPKKKLSFDPFTDEMKEFVGLYIKAVSMALKLTNQTKLPDSYDPKMKF